MFAIVDRKNNNRIGEHISGQLLVFTDMEAAETRYAESGFAEYCKHDTTVDWQIAPVLVLVQESK